MPMQRPATRAPSASDTWLASSPELSENVPKGPHIPKGPHNCSPGDDSLATRRTSARNRRGAACGYGRQPVTLHQKRLLVRLFHAIPHCLTTPGVNACRRTLSSNPKMKKTAGRSLTELTFVPGCSVPGSACHSRRRACLCRHSRQFLPFDQHRLFIGLLHGLPSA